MSSRRQPHPGGGRGLAGRCVATQLRGLALRLADPLAEAQPLLHLPQDPQPGIVDGICVFLVYSINKSYHKGTGTGFIYVFTKKLSSIIFSSTCHIRQVHTIAILIFVRVY